jgi:AcrR family transcriptional regulator
MKDELGPGRDPGVLTPSVPRDIGVRTQRQRVLDAMAHSCAEKSFAATTIADVVSRASISRATFYKHFVNKRECFDVVVEDFIAELVQAATEAQTSAKSRPDAIRDAIGEVLARLAAKPAHARLAVIEAPILEPGIFADHREKAVGGLKDQWGEDKSDNGARADARLAFGRAHLLIADCVAAGKAKDLPGLQQEVVYVLLLPFVGHNAALAQVKLAP